jgi:ATP-binding cassette subfamily B protein
MVHRLPDGYNTHGRRGATLSGGQKQRLAPRAAARSAHPHLDDQHQRRSPKESLLGLPDHLMRGRTSFVIAQRISTVMSADRILVLDGGRVVAQGKHADLMEDEPIYAEIYNSQILAHDQAHAGQEK